MYVSCLVPKSISGQWLILPSKENDFFLDQPFWGVFVCGYHSLCGGVNMEGFYSGLGGLIFESAILGRPRMWASYLAPGYYLPVDDTLAWGI